MAEVLILSFSEIYNDPRVMRHINALCDDYSLTVAGYGKEIESACRFISVPKTERTKFGKFLKASRLALRMYESYYWKHIEVKSILTKLQESKFDIIIANDIETLPLALKLSRGQGIVLFDAHEYAPLEFEEVKSWRLLESPYKTYLCKKYIPIANHHMTVSGQIAKAYEKLTGMSFQVLTNAPEYVKREYQEVNPEAIKLIHHGHANPHRNLEALIDLCKYLDCRFELNLMLVGNVDYIKHLKNYAKGHERIKFVDAVPMKGIVDALTRYDIGVYLLKPTSFNNNMALPNKLYEFIQAGLMIIVGETLEMKELVLKYKLGIVSENEPVEILANRLNNLDEETINGYKKASLLAAETLCEQVNYNHFKHWIKCWIGD